ncbi:hypothetical protein RN001_008366 [Aquatica leii]|uniref:FAD dependent oxidoreductase domain-containing protein n=1 Tax=Aquatica leii TaxID=1421715 RepID=A0AAN7Q536_9COLE|nr:hypothetical protein RN001_008366 [Aquatica leii]
MFRKEFYSVCKKFVLNRRIHTSVVSCDNVENFEHPLKRTVRVLAQDFQRIVRKANKFTSDGIFPTHADIVIIGGAAIGSSIAYFLKHKTGLTGLRVVVIEKDNTYSQCSTVLSLGGLRQQFSLAENIQMSLFGAEFLRTLKHRFGPDADVHFTPNGYLMLATEHGAQQLLDNAKLQKHLGAINTVLNKDDLKQRFPWLNVDDVEVGCFGLEKEGWFDPWALLTILKRGAINLGAEYIQGEAVGFSFKTQQDIYMDGALTGSYEGLDAVQIKLPDGETKSIKFAYCVIAAGAESGKIAKLAKVGCGPEMLTVPLPVERRKRYVYCFDCQGEPPGLNTPLTVDYTGAYFRREGLGGSFLAGLSPPPEEEPDVLNLDVDHQYFDDKLWPLLAHRVPAFNSIKVRSAWGGYYDFNAFDENGIIGPHPYYYNLYFATGFSGHGIQQSPAVGRAIAEHIVDGRFQTLDLTRLGFDRLLLDKPMYEVCIV